MTDEAEFPWRMYVYNCRIFVMYNREVASFAVLGDDNPGWRPNRFGYRGGAWRFNWRTRSSSSWTMRQDGRN